ncbi:hypothetical protein V6N12_057631 [Hibiscus sabdariffa]|uniref:Uncharacterized protein n=1 Tax=Hibiscus sabdariffa TaxID=183260 RepID=A0ABR2C5Q8_9ROSI
MPRGIGKLTSLQTLSMFVMDKDGSHCVAAADLSELSGLNNLRGELEITPSTSFLFSKLKYFHVENIEELDRNMLKECLQNMISLKWFIVVAHMKLMRYVSFTRAGSKKEWLQMLRMRNNCTWIKYSQTNNMLYVRAIEGCLKLTGHKKLAVRMKRASPESTVHDEINC